MDRTAPVNTRMSPLSTKIPKLIAHRGNAAEFPENSLPGLRSALELGITHMESLCNLESLLGAGQFQFIGLPLKFRGGTGSPIRAVAVFEN